MPELDGELGAVPVNRGGDLREPRYLVVVPQPGLGERRREGAAVHVGAADDDQADAATGPLLVIGRGQLVELRGLRRAYPGRTGGRKHDPVFQHVLAQRELAEQPREPQTSRGSRHRPTIPVALFRAVPVALFRVAAATAVDADARILAGPHPALPVGVTSPALQSSTFPLNRAITGLLTHDALCSTMLPRQEGKLG